MTSRRNPRRSLYWRSGRFFAHPARTPHRGVDRGQSVGAQVPSKVVKPQGGIKQFPTNRLSVRGVYADLCRRLPATLRSARVKSAIPAASIQEPRDKGTGWQAIFWFLALFGAASLVALLKIVPETLESSRRATAGLRVTLLDYAGHFRRGRLAW